MNLQTSVNLALATSFLCVLTACSQTTADDHLAQATEYRESSQLNEAIIEYRAALQIDANRGDIRKLLGEAYLEARNGAGALQEFVRAADLLTDDADAQLKAGAMLLLSGQFVDAETRAKNALELEPSNTEAQILLANAMAGLQDLDGALAQYQEAVALNPSHDMAFAGLGSIQVARGELEAAEASFRRAVEVAPDSLNARLALANFLWSSNRLADAEDALKAALEIDPNNVVANQALGVFYLSSGRAPDAEPHFQAIARIEESTAAGIALADYYVMTQRFPDARAVLLDLAKEEQAWPASMTRLAAIDGAEGFRAEGMARLREVLEAYPTEQSARLLLARLLLADGERQDALAEAETIAEQDPNSPAAAEAYMVIGSVYRMLDRPEASVRAYEEVLTRHPQPFGAQMELVSLHLSTRQPDKARTYLQQALAIQPGNPVARALMVRILLAEQNLDEARTELATLEDEFPDSPTVLKLLGNEQAAAGQLAAARASFTRAAQMLPNDLEPFAGLVQLDLMEGKEGDALDRVERGLGATEKSGDLLVLAARVYAASGDMDRAEDLLREAVDLDPDRLMGYSMLAQLYVNQNRLNEAELQFEQMVGRDPESVSTNTMLGMIYDMRGRFAEAEQQYTAVLAIDPTAAVAANNLAYRYAESEENLNRALSLAETARQRLPGDWNVSDTLGWVYYRLGLTSSAIRELETSVQENPSDPLNRYHLGLAYQQDGDIQRAVESLRAALAISDSFPEAEAARQALSLMGG